MTPITGGWCIKVRDDGQFCIDVLAMLYNYRVTLTRHPGHQFVEHGWCYYGHGEGRSMVGAQLAALAAAQVWDGYGCPAGYDKQAC